MVKSHTIGFILTFLDHKLNSLCFYKHNACVLTNVFLEYDVVFIII